ncbi:MAG: hypothetical protein KDD39_16845, partial [Bdellovibrionales bacterium]|nr:hypothetical protein [Bdellovibrionales bacterium]
FHPGSLCRNQFLIVFYNDYRTLDREFHFSSLTKTTTGQAVCGGCNDGSVSACARRRDARQVFRVAAGARAAIAQLETGRSSQDEQ